MLLKQERVAEPPMTPSVPAETADSVQPQQHTVGRRKVPASVLLVGATRPDAVHEAHEHEQRRNRQENPYRESLVGGESQVNHDASEDQCNR
jgi:hypothetical protein